MLVGIERYDEGLAFPRCQGAAHDAASVARWMIETAGWSADHVLLLTDQNPADLGFPLDARRPEHRRPTKHALDLGVRQWLGTKAAPGDVLLVFFAGQAVSLPARADDPPGRVPRDFLLPVDAREADLERTGWRLGEAIEELAARGDFSIVCVLDTSPLGRIRSPGAISDQARSSALGERMLKGIVRWPGVTAWLAATDVPSGVTSDGDGVLTRALIQGLGSQREPRNLLYCLDRIRRDPVLARQRFRTAGGCVPELALWGGNVRTKPPKVEPLLQNGHADRVTAVGFTSDGARLFSSSMDSTVRIWRTSDAVLLRVLPVHRNGSRSLSVGADGRLLVAGGGMGEMLFYDLVRESYKQLPPTFPHRGPVDRVAVLTDGLHAVSLDNQGCCILWDAREATVKLVSQVTESGGRLLAIAPRPAAGAAAFCLMTPGEGDREVVRLVGIDGTVLRKQPAPSAGVTALSLADDGTRFAIGTSEGLVATFDSHGEKTRPDFKISGSVDQLAILPLWLAAGSGRSLRIIPHEGAEPPGILLDEAIGRVSFTADGRRVAAVGKFDGSVGVWDIAADGASSPLKLEKVPGAALSLAFSPGGDAVIIGDGDGRIRRWRIPEGKSEPMAPASPSRRVRHAAVAPDGKSLLQITSDGPGAGKALLWVFGDGRGTRTILGSYLPAGVFTPEGDPVLIDSRGDVCVLDRATLDRKPTSFEPPTAAGRRLNARFDSLSIAPGGLTLAAASRDAAMACAWTIADGRLIQQIPDRDAGMINAVAYSGDGRILLTAGEDGLVKLWDATARDPHDPRILGLDGAGAVDPPGVITAAAFSPVDSNLIAAGRRIVRDGRTEGSIELWDVKASKSKRIARLGGEVHALAFSSDGKMLAGGGDDLQIVLYATEGQGRQIPLGSGQNHYETTNSLAFWPNSKLLASASDDTTVRIWRLGDGSLIGTFAGSNDGSDWVFFTPDGSFDASPEGERRVTWRLDSERGADAQIVRLEQLHQQRHVFDLANNLLVKPPNNEALQAANPLPPAAPPQLTIETAMAYKANERKIDLKIRIGTPDYTDLRLYHNGVAVPGDLKSSGTDAKASLTLVSGLNRIYALAGRDGSIEGRSNELTLVHEGPTRGRTHVLALGVSKYKTQALRFADKDAEAIAALLGRNGADAKAADFKPIVLLNDDLKIESFEHAFEELLRRVRGHPEDTIVVFLAGHTEVRREMFCLLLPTATLPAGPDLVALRGPVGDEPRKNRATLPTNDPSVLPYARIHRSLSALEALQRLVIIDACQAEAIFDDPEVRARNRLAMRRQAEKDAYRARTSYILATRRGERSTEPPALEHGLLTYVLLHAMGAPDLATSRELAIFQKHPTADFDGDGWIDTAELQQYARLTIPTLVKQFPVFLPRGPATRGRTGSVPSEDAISQDVVKTEAFRLIEASPRTVLPKAR